MIDRAHRAADSEISKLERQLGNDYRRASKNIKKRWKAYLSEIDDDIQKLTIQYETAADEVGKRMAGRKLATAKRERIMNDNRYRKLVDDTADKLANVNKEALDIINGRREHVYQDNRQFVHDEVGTSIGTPVNDRVKSNLSKARRLDRAKDVTWNVKRLNSEVLQSILAGEPVTELANRLVKVIGENYKSALRLARTIITGAQNEGRLDGMLDAEEMGIIVEKEWIATEDERTRPEHMDLNGVIIPVHEPFDVGGSDMMFPADKSGRPDMVYNCRCTMATVVRGFKKMG